MATVVRIYVFGDNYGIHTLRDLVLDKIVEDTTSFKEDTDFRGLSPIGWIDFEMVIYVHGNTPGKFTSSQHFCGFLLHVH